VTEFCFSILGGSTTKTGFSAVMGMAAGSTGASSGARCLGGALEAACYSANTV
jgi:hypothetical protein